MLHGKIEVNEAPIGQWSAVRKDSVMNGVHRYDCFVEYYNLEGYPKRAEFQVIHSEAWGALQLASQVIATAVRKMR